MTVRHPFERILSAYRDKFVYNNMKGEELFYNEYGKNIITSYRKETPENSLYLQVPTFKEFVRYLIDVNFTEYDNHWMPYFVFCTPCHVHYSYIAKTETINDDSLYIKQVLQSLGMTISEQEEEEATMNRLNKAHELTEEDYSNIPKSMIQSLYKKYEIDFLMFGYEMESYFSYAIQE